MVEYMLPIIIIGLYVCPIIIREFISFIKKGGE